MERLDNNALANKVTIRGLLVNVFLVIIKLVTGFIYNSTAMLADGINSLTDIISDIFILISLRFSNMPEDDEHNYGHEKLEVVAGAIVSAFIVIAGYEMLTAGIDRLLLIYKGEIEYKISVIILIVAATTVIAKEILYRYMKKYSLILDSDILKAKAWDSRTDSISTGTMFIGLTIAIALGDKWSILDPLFAIIMAIYVIIVGFTLIKNSLGNLIDPSLGKEELEKIKDIILSIDGAVDPHNIRTLKLGRNVSLNMHLRVDPNMTVENAHKISVEVEKKLRNEYGAKSYIYVHIEPIKEDNG